MKEAPFKSKENMCLALSYHVGIEIIRAYAGHYYKRHFGVDKQENPNEYDRKNQNLNVCFKVA